MKRIAVYIDTDAVIASYIDKIISLLTWKHEWAWCFLTIWFSKFRAAHEVLMTIESVLG